MNLLIHATTWMNLENVLSERNMSYMQHLMWANLLNIKIG